jgi:hypothetical protein
MSREGRKINHGTWLVVGLVAAILLGAAIIWLTGPKLWTDDRTIRVADSGAQLRQVLWEKPRPLGPQFQSDQQQYEPSFSPDGNEFYFVRNKPGLNADIYVSYRSNNQWSAPVPLQAVNSAYDDLGPRVTADGKFLLFYSDRPGGFGGYDIWASARTDDGWGQPFNLGPQVNSEYNEFSPDPTPDGKHLIFATNRKAAAGEQKQAWRATIRQTENGDYDLWMAEPDPQAPSIPSPGTPGEGKGGGSGVLNAECSIKRNEHLFNHYLLHHPAFPAKPPPQPSPGVPEEGEDAIAAPVRHFQAARYVERPWKSALCCLAICTP